MIEQYIQYIQHHFDPKKGDIVTSMTRARFFVIGAKKNTEFYPVGILRNFYVGNPSCEVTELQNNRVATISFAAVALVLPFFFALDDHCLCIDLINLSGKSLCVS